MLVPFIKQATEFNHGAWAIDLNYVCRANIKRTGVYICCQLGSFGEFE